MRALKHALQQHPFLLLGLTTLGLFFLVEALARNGLDRAAATAAVPMRFLILPMYVIWLVFTMAQVYLSSAGSPNWVLELLYIVGLTVGLLPYFLADRLLARWRRGRLLRHTTT